MGLNLIEQHAQHRSLQPLVYTLTELGASVNITQMLGAVGNIYVCTVSLDHSKTSVNTPNCSKDVSFEYTVFLVMSCEFKQVEAHFFQAVLKMLP